MYNLTFFQHNFAWILPLLILDIVLKLLAMWRAAKKEQVYWFIALAVINTAGILPLIYLLLNKSPQKSRR